MGVDKQILAFERWSKERGLVTRDVDRKRVAREVLEAAGGGAVEQEHIDRVIKKFRDGLMGARSVLAAQRVGKELLEWQDDPEAAPVEEEEPPPREQRAVREGSGRAKPAEPSSALADLGEWEEPAPSARPGSIRPESTRPESTRPESMRPGSMRPGSMRPSERPPPETWGEQAEGPRSLRSDLPPRVGTGLDVDDQPKRFAPGRSRPPSRPPASVVAALPEVEMSEEGVSEERRQRARLEHSEDSFAPPPMPKEGTKPLTLPPQLAPVVTRVDATTWMLNSKTLTLIGSALLVVVFGLVILTRPSCLFADPGKQVAGQFSSKHLGVAWAFPEPWLHAEDLDDDEDLEGGWERRASVFYRGRSAADYQSQLVVVTFARDKTKVTEDDARQLGANEVVGAASMRQCAPFDLRGVKGTRCGAMTVRGTRPMGLLELYFPLTEHAVFLRYTFEANLPTPSQDMREMETQSRMNEEAMADRIRQTLEIVSSIRELNQK